MWYCRHRSIFFLLVCFNVSTFACSHRILAPMEPEKLQQERLLYVKLISGKEIKVKKPRFDEEHLCGLTPRYDTRPGPYEEIKIALDDIVSIKVERYDQKKTIVSLTAVAISLALFFYIVIGIGSVGESLR